MTPFESWYGKRPSVKHLRVFGCIVYKHIPKDERKKLDLKAKKCILLGYSTQRKGYWLYELDSKKITHSRDVIFNETSSVELEQKETKLIQVECFPDESDNEITEDREPTIQESEDEPQEANLPATPRRCRSEKCPPWIVSGGHYSLVNNVPPDIIH